MADPLLSVAGLNAYYGAAHILRSVSFDVAQGEVLALVGRNGAGKSTTLRAIMGLVRPRGGTVRFAGVDVAGLEAFRICRLGIGYVPEDRRVFAALTVAQNLFVGARPPRPDAPAWTLKQLHTLFPNLAERRDLPAGRLSGGEQQMLSVARTLMGNPRLLLLDEPSEGLAPKVVAEMAAAVVAMKREGLTVLLSEQNLSFARSVCDRGVVLERGEVRFAGDFAALGIAPEAAAAMAI